MMHSEPSTNYRRVVDAKTDSDMEVIQGRFLVNFSKNASMRMADIHLQQLDAR